MDDNKYVVSDNIPILDEIVYNLKKMALSCVVKDEEEGDYYETLETKQNFDLYRACVEGTERFEFFTYTKQDFVDAFLPDSLLEECYNDNSKTPFNIKVVMTANAKKKTLENYIEKNDYYRMLNGQPPLGEAGIYVTNDMLPERLVGNIDISKPIHEMSISECNTLYSFGVIDDLKTAHPTARYLDYTGSRKIDYYRARMAPKFSLLNVNEDVPLILLNKFKDKFEMNRVFVLKTEYSIAYKYGSDYYDNFIMMMITIQTMVDIIVEMPDMIIKKDIFDARTVQLLFASNGVDSFEGIPLKYQLAMVKNLNRLIKFKSTTKNIVDICSIFGFENIKLFKYFLLRDRKMTKDKEFIFEYKDIINEDTGLTERVEDLDKEYDLRFVKVPIEDNADNYMNDKANYMDYDEIVMGDKYWNGDRVHEDVKSEILNREFNYLQSKYICIDTIYEMTELSFELTYFYNMLFDNKMIEDELLISIPFINGNTKFRFVDVICYLFALMYLYNNVEDDIMDTQTKIMSIKGFNFRADMAALGEYIHEKGFTMEELGVSDFQMPDSYLLSYTQLMNIFTKNKKIYDHVVKQMVTADNKRIYDVYKKIYDSLMINKLTFDFFKKKDGTISKTFTEFLSNRDLILYYSILDIKKEQTESVKKQKIADIITNAVYCIEEYVDTKQYKFIFSQLPAVSAEAVKGYLYRVINFFKSYKIQIESINTIYLFDDKLENTIKMIDEVIITHCLYKDETIEMISKIQNTSKLNYEERMELLEKLYIDITYWLDKYFITNASPEDRFTSLASTIKDDKYLIKDSFKSIISKLKKYTKYNIVDSTIKNTSLTENEKIRLLERIYMEITYWEEKYFKEDLEFRDNIVYALNLIYKEKPEIVEEKYLTIHLDIKDKVSISDTIKITSV